MTDISKDDCDRARGMCLSHGLYGTAELIDDLQDRVAELEALLPWLSEWTVYQPNSVGLSRWEIAHKDYDGAPDANDNRYFHGDSKMSVLQQAVDYMVEAARSQEVKSFLEEFVEHKFKEVRNFSGPSPADELEATTEHGPVAAFQEDAQALLERAFPKRCKGGDMDHFTGDCLWCGAPMGGTCQDTASPVCQPIEDFKQEQSQ